MKPYSSTDRDLSIQTAELAVDRSLTEFQSATDRLAQKVEEQTAHLMIYKDKASQLWNTRGNIALIGIALFAAGSILKSLILINRRKI